jgi:hypothetical protein
MDTILRTDMNANKPDIDELRAEADAAKSEAQAAQSKAREARMRYDVAEREERDAQSKAIEAHQKLLHALAAQGVLTDVLGNEGDKRVWCLGDEGDCMGDCGGRFHDTQDTLAEVLARTEEYPLTATP